MHTHKSFPDPAHARSLFDEADIGSGEKSAAQLETEAMIREIPALPSLDEREDPDDADERDDAEQADAGQERREHDASLERDEPSGDLDSLDPVPPKGN